MTRKTRTKTPYQVDVLTIILVTALVLFGLMTVLNVFCDPFDGSEKELSDYIDRMHFAFPSRQVGNILISLLVAVPLAIFDYDLYKPFAKTPTARSAGTSSARVPFSRARSPRSC